MEKVKGTAGNMHVAEMERPGENGDGSEGAKPGQSAQANGNQKHRQNAVRHRNLHASSMLGGRKTATAHHHFLLEMNCK
jgi:hypothetical protein